MNWRRSSVVLSAFIFLMGIEASAQSRLEVRTTAGLALVYFDEAWPPAGGGAVHYRIASNFLVGGELLYIAGPQTHNILTAMPVASWEFRGTQNIRPYLIGGIGWARTGGSFSFGADYRRITGNGGVGVKIRLSDRFFIAPEFRIGGDEPIMTTTVSMGIRF